MSNSLTFLISSASNIIVAFSLFITSTEGVFAEEDPNQVESFPTTPNAHRTIEKNKPLAHQGASAIDKHDHELRTIDLLIEKAEDEHEAGQFYSARKHLNDAISLATEDKAPFRFSIAKYALGRLDLIQGHYDSARSHILEGIHIAEGSSYSDALPAGWISMANLFAAQNKVDDALRAFQKAHEIATPHHNPTISAKALVNAANIALIDKQDEKSDFFLKTAIPEIKKISSARIKANLLLAAGEIAFSIHRQSNKVNSRHKLNAHTLFEHASQIGVSIGDKTIESLALGNLGQLYENDKRIREALELTNRAIFLLQNKHRAYIVYRWQWQKGRLLKALDDDQNALAAYRESIEALQNLRQSSFYLYRSRHRSFRQQVGNLFLEYADLLLTRSDQLKDSATAESLLLDARRAMEQLKTVEMKDYFQDDCVAALQAKLTPLEKILDNTAVLYPIILNDRTELLLARSDGIKKFRVPIDKTLLIEKVRKFRRLIEKRTTRQYINPAQQLYKWLIRPLEADLSADNIDTLVIVPDGPLRTIPFSALHNGKEYLISQYMVAITPGLSLMDPRPLSRANMQVLANGITKAVHGFPPLPFVESEMAAIKQFYGGEQLINETFLMNRMHRELTKNEYTIVHIASHGQFKSNPQETFVLTYDDKLTMNNLEQLIKVGQFRNNPVELLTLSACETAAGDDRAALGLAGVAIKAGARSALATLWVSNDEATALLMNHFYQQLKVSHQSKAKALQQAQLMLIQDNRFNHAIYWSPFILIGNWL